MLHNEYLQIIGKIEALERGELKAGALPEKCFFLDGDTILCRPRDTGDSRFPYGTGGYTLWAHSSGNISINESTFYVIQPSDEGKEPYLSFFGGIKKGERYVPVSVTGAARQPLEEVTRYTVFTPKCVYYIARTQEADFILRIFNGSDKDKQTVFSAAAYNRTEEEKELYISGFFNCLLMYSPYESNETKWFKSCKVLDGGFLFHSVVDIDRKTHVDNRALLKVNLQEDVAAKICTTTSRSDYAGGKNNSLNCSTSLFTGEFAEGKSACKFTDTAAAGNLIKIRLGAKKSYRADYILKVFTEGVPVSDAEMPVSFAETDRMIAEHTAEEIAKYQNDSMLKMSFSDSRDGMVEGNILTDFLHNVQRQVWYCALAKNSGVSLLGIRDVFQQLEACLIWDPAACRAKILEALSFTNVNGRLPRQYSLPPKKDAVPQMDLRAFIDQGAWVIDTVYQYLCYTGDYSLLNEECGYLDFTDGTVKLTDRRDTVLDHLLLIVKYLTDNIDHGQTNCLRILYGDWNDALDGLGVTEDPDKEFGTGVSVMATLQLYDNLREMSEILQQVGGHSGEITFYQTTRSALKAGLQKFAVVEKNGRRKILHGWGDKYGYLVGSFHDVDGKERDGLIVNAFWIISGALEWDPSLKQDILASYHRLDSKYGLKTFEPYFAKNTKGVGRIVNLPKGTAENAATYVHASLFGIWSLFACNESRSAFEQLKKILPLTHEKISTTPFIMSNSYVSNEEYGMDGESMSDWFTGSANVLVKTFVRYVFGIRPSLNDVTVQPAEYLPFASCKINVKVKNCVIELDYRNEGGGKRRFMVNGEEALAIRENDSADKIILTNELLSTGKLLISVIN